MKDTFLTKYYKRDTIGTTTRGHSFQPIDNEKPVYIYDLGTHLVSEAEYTTDRPNGTSDYQLIYVVSGKGHFFINGTEFIADSGDIVLYKPREPQLYKYFASEKTRVYYMHFGGTRAESLLKECDLYTDTIYHIGLDTDIENTFIRILDCVLYQNDFFEIEVCSHFYMLFTLLARQRKFVSNFNSKHLKKIHPALDHLRKNFETDVTVAELASMCNLSTSRFIHIFSECLGMSPNNYKNSLRIEQATVLLKVTDKSISEIAYLLGYSDPLYFSKYFRKITGCSPHKFRKTQ